MDKEVQPLKNKLSVFAALCAMVVLITASSQVIESCRRALMLCSDLILPSLFPFFVVSVLLNKLGFPAILGKLLAPLAARAFKVSGAGASALFIGLTGGYPLGAAYIADLHEDGIVSSSEAEHLLAFCNNSGPAFIVGAVGVGVFRSAGIGLLLYAVHIMAAVTTGLILRPRLRAAALQPSYPKPLPISQALPLAVRQSVISVLNVCGFVVCFSVFTGLLDVGGFFSLASGELSRMLGTELHWSRALLTGTLELGSGIGAMLGLSPSPANLALAALILGWGGISVHFQTLSVLADSQIKGTLHFAGRLVSACVGAILAFFLAHLI